jgi:hypothetical protein
MDVKIKVSEGANSVFPCLLAVLRCQIFCKDAFENSAGNQSHVDSVKQLSIAQIGLRSSIGSHNLPPKTWQGCESRTPPPSSRSPQRDHRAQDPLANPSGSLHFYPINLGVLRFVELLRYTNHGTRLAPIVTQKGSNRGQRLETTGRPPNTSRARKHCKTRHFRDFEQA